MLIVRDRVLEYVRELLQEVESDSSFVGDCESENVIELIIESVLDCDPLVRVFEVVVERVPPVGVLDADTDFETVTERVMVRVEEESTVDETVTLRRFVKEYVGEIELEGVLDELLEGETVEVTSDVRVADDVISLENDCVFVVDFAVEGDSVAVTEVVRERSCEAVLLSVREIDTDDDRELEFVFVSES